MEEASLFKCFWTFLFKSYSFYMVFRVQYQLSISVINASV